MVDQTLGRTLGTLCITVCPQNRLVEFLSLLNSSSFCTKSCGFCLPNNSQIHPLLIVLPTSALDQDLIIFQLISCHRLLTGLWTTSFTPVTHPGSSHGH